MKLKMLVLEGDKEIEKKNGVTPISFQAFHVIQIFMDFLPKIELDGTTKLVIYFKQRSESELKYNCDGKFHVSWYFLDQDVIKEKESIGEDKIEDYYLGIISSTLKEIAILNNCNPEIIKVIDDTVQKVKDCKYEIYKKIKSLSKISHDKCYKANVYRAVNKKGERWYVEMIGKYKDVRIFPIMQEYSHITKIDFYKKSIWEGNKFILLNRLDKVVSTIQID